MKTEILSRTFSNHKLTFAYNSLEMTKHLGTLHPQKNRLNYEGLYLEHGRKNVLYLRLEGLSCVRQYKREAERVLILSSSVSLCLEGAHVCTVCKHTQLLCE